MSDLLYFRFIPINQVFRYRDSWLEDMNKYPEDFEQATEAEYLECESQILEFEKTNNIRDPLEKLMKDPKGIPCLKNDRLERHANGLAGFFGHSVFLVGSQLTRDDPRDVDLVIIIPDSEFVLRYINQFEVIGHTDQEKCEQWGYRYLSGLYNESNWVWARDMVHKNLKAMEVTSMLVDLKVLPESYHKRQYADKPKLKISTDGFSNELSYIRTSE